MTPQEKAEELVGKYEICTRPVFTLLQYEVEKAYNKQCALIAVDEIIESRKEDKGFNDKLLSDASEYWSAHPMYLTYWEQVKKEIEKL